MQSLARTHQAARCWLASVSSMNDPALGLKSGYAWLASVSSMNDPALGRKSGYAKAGALTSRCFSSSKADCCSCC